MALISIYGNLSRHIAPVVVPPVSTFDLDGARIITDGNSLTHGVGASDADKAYPIQLQLNPIISVPDAQIINLSISGQTTDDMIARGSIIDGYMYIIGKSYIIAWELINQMAISPANSPLPYTRLKEYCLARKAIGWIIVVMTGIAVIRTTPYSTTDGYYNALKGYNQQLRDTYTEFADYLIDLAADPRLNIMNSIYFNPDQIHMNDNGYLLVSQIIADFMTSH